MTSVRRKFSTSQKLHILQQVEEFGVTKVLKQYNLSYSVYSRWKQQQAANREDDLMAQQEKTHLQEENMRLKKIIADLALEMERKDEDLKKINPMYGRR